MTILYEEENFIELPENFANSEFLGCQFKQLDLTQSRFQYAKFFECQFYHCNLSNISVDNSRMRDIDFNNCKLLGVNWTHAALFDQIRAHESQFDLCSFQAMKLNGFFAQSCSFKEADFSEANLEKADFRGSDFAKALFQGANLRHADFSYALNYFIDPKFTQVKDARFTLPEATSFLLSIGIKFK